MKQCLQQMIVSMLIAGVTSFLVVVKPTSTSTSFPLRDLPENVEVCGFKDCKRAGGGVKLEKLINAVSLIQSKVMNLNNCKRMSKNVCLHFFFLQL